MCAEQIQYGELEKSARYLYEYLSLYEKPQKAGLVMGFGIDDMRVPDTCSRIYHSSHAPLILFTGGIGRGSGSLEVPEAAAFKDRALLSGIPSGSILTEHKSTNTLENVLFSIKLLEERRLKPKSIILVAKPHLQRRAWLTCKKHFKGTVLLNHPYPSSFEEESRWYKDRKTFFMSLAGEITRILKYGKAGDLEDEPLPPDIVPAYTAVNEIN